MNDYTPEPRRPGRPTNAEVAARAAQNVPSEVKSVLTESTRSEEVKARRRRREGLGDERNLKLYVPEQMKDPNFNSRWVNDRAGRVRQLTVEDDWDVVDTAKLGGDPDPGINTAEGTVINRVGDKFTGERMVLLQKPKEYFEKDRAEKAARLDQIEASMRRKPPAAQGGLGDADNAYIPGGKNTIGGK
jgi:hypothetical protein